MGDSARINPEGYKPDGGERFVITRILGQEGDEKAATAALEAIPDSITHMKWLFLGTSKKKI